jgi:hypothetical protein
MDAFLNVFFFVFHSGLILFVLFGWTWKKTRLVNLVVILLVAFSWFVLGLRYGYGYCPSTDWHWQVRARMGYPDMPSSYTKFLVDSFTGWNVDQTVVDVFTLALLVFALGASLLVNLRDMRRKRGSPYSKSSRQSDPNSEPRPTKERK